MRLAAPGRAALVAALAALAAGCAGGDGNELAERADPVCARANAAVSDLDRPRSVEQLLRYVEEASDVVERRRAELAAIEPPEDDAEEWRAFLAANDRAIAALVDVRESTVTGRGGDEAIQAFNTAEADARRLAEELGLDECATQPPQPAGDESETGGGETETGPADTGAAAPQSAWAARADEICGEAQGRIDALPQPTDPLQAAGQVGQVSGIVKREIGDLRELDPPAGEEERVDAFLAALERGAAALDDLAQALAGGNQAAADAAVAEGEAAAEVAQREADALGLTVCGAA